MMTEWGSLEYTDGDGQTITNTNTLVFYKQQLVGLDGWRIPGITPCQEAAGTVHDCVGKSP